MTDAQIHAAPTAHGFRPAVRHPQSCIAPHASCAITRRVLKPVPLPHIAQSITRNCPIFKTERLHPPRWTAAIVHSPRHFAAPQSWPPQRRSVSPVAHPTRRAPAPPVIRTNASITPALMPQQAVLTERQNCIALPMRKTKAASTRLLLRMNAAQQPNPRGGQPPRAYSLTLNTASLMLSPPLMPSASRFGRCASSGNITMKSPSRISTRAPSPSAKNSMSCSGS